MCKTCLFPKPAFPCCFSILSKPPKSLHAYEYNVIPEYRTIFYFLQHTYIYMIIIEKNKKKIKKKKKNLGIRCFWTILVWAWGRPFAVSLTLQQQEKNITLINNIKGINLLIKSSSTKSQFHEPYHLVNGTWIDLLQMDIIN